MVPNRRSAGVGTSQGRRPRNNLKPGMQSFLPKGRGAVSSRAGGAGTGVGREPGALAAPETAPILDPPPLRTVHRGACGPAPS